MTQVFCVIRIPDEIRFKSGTDIAGNPAPGVPYRGTPGALFFVCFRKTLAKSGIMWYNESKERNQQKESAHGSVQ